MQKNLPTQISPTSQNYSLYPLAQRIFAWLRAVKKIIEPDIEAVFFSIKCFAAAIIALYVSLNIGLNNPVWAVGAVYTVSMPFSGAAISRSFFRLLGTLGGAAAVILLVPTFVNEPLVLSGVLAAWTGFCLYLALLDRTARAYAFQLAGYMTCLIGFPYVAAADDIFNVASLRVQEVSIGILSATLVHALVLPRSMSDRVRARVAALLGDAERWTRDTLAQAPQALLVQDRIKIATGLLELHQNAIHLPFDSAHPVPKVQLLRTLHDRLLVVLSLSSAIEDSLAELRVDGPDLSADLASLFECVRGWLDPSNGLPDVTGTDDLLAKLRQAPMDISGTATWCDLLAANVVSDLHDLVAAHQDCRLLQRALAVTRPGWLRRLPARLTGPGQGYVFHRDHWLAARSGIGAAVSIMLCCCFWIASGWADGASALFIVGPLCVLCGTVDAPVGNVVRSLLGMVVGLVVGLIYGFAIFPRTTDFITLAAVLAPVLLATGVALARPPLAFAAVTMVLTFPVIAGLAPTNGANFSSALNSSIATLIGGAMTLFSVRLFQTIGTGYVTGRILRAIRRDVASRMAGRNPDTARWTSVMLDRIGLLIPRLTGDDRSTNLLRFALADLRMGLAASSLRALGETLGERPARALLSVFFGDAAAHFRHRATSGEGRSLRYLLAQIDGVRDAMATEAAPIRERVLPLLSALRRDLLLRVADHGM